MKWASLSQKLRESRSRVHLPSSIMDDEGPRSLFAVVHYAYRDPEDFSILQLDLQEKTIVVQKKDVIHLNKDRRGCTSIGWLFSPSTATEDLYMVPNWGFDNLFIRTVKPLTGYRFDLSTGSCHEIPHPLSSLRHGLVVNVTGRIYFLAHDWFLHKKLSVFQCYDRETNLWNRLEPFPHDLLADDIVGSAVLGDTILFNVVFNADSRIWAYDVILNKWYPVEVKDTRCYGFIGEAVVVGDTIYALTNRSFNRILVLSIKKRGTDLVCSCSEHFVPGIRLIFEKDDAAWVRTRHLLHLGKDNFCVVQSCNFYYFKGYQPIQVTYLKFEGGYWMTGKNHICKVKTQADGRFEFTRCFFLPKGATTVLKEEGNIFNLMPYPEEDYPSNPVQEEEIVIPVQEEEIVTPVQEEEIVTLHKDGLHATSELFRDNDSSQTNIIYEQGHSVYVANLSRDATVQEIEKGLKKFGPIKRDGIQLVKQKRGKCFAFVEFESATSRQHAIEASTVIIGKIEAHIAGKTSTGRKTSAGNHSG